MSVELFPRDRTREVFVLGCGNRVDSPEKFYNDDGTYTYNIMPVECSYPDRLCKVCTHFWKPFWPDVRHLFGEK